MASKIYNQEVIFLSVPVIKVVNITLKKCPAPVWIPVLITEKKTRTVLLHLYLSAGIESLTPITFLVPLFVGLSSEVGDYSYGRDDKESVNDIKKNSNVGTFSVDVSHDPPSTYTVKDLDSGEFDNEPSRPPPSEISQTRRAALGDNMFFIQEGLRKLYLSTGEKTPNGRTHAQLASEFDRANRKSRQHISLIFLKDKETGIISLFSTMNSEMTFPFQLRPVCDYELLVVRGYEPKQCLFLINAVALCSFKTYMTQTEVYLLHEKACTHSSCPRPGPSYVPVKYLYRSKPVLHFLHIFNNTNGVMYKYIKNFGGDPASTLNKKLHGLFFSANVDPVTGQPPALSYYGDKRIHIPVGFMINQNTNLYFADFYCHYVNHHVTLVITLKGSEADVFCQQRLLALNPAYNEFLFRRPHEQHAMVNTRVTVEVFYTESIDVAQFLKSKFAYLTSVEQLGNAELKTIIGLPKRKDCKICNIKEPL